MKALKFVLLTLTISVLASCGGGGGGGTTTAGGGGTNAPSQRVAALKLATSGTPSALLAGIDITVTLPSGVTPALNSDGTVATTVATVSGVAAPGTMLAPVYTQASGTVKGTLRLAMASSITAGFGAGEFATVSCVVATGSTPAQSDFTLSGFNPIDVNGSTATGLTAAVANLTVQ